MVYRLHWLRRAAQDLDDIFLYYKQVAGENVSKRRLSRIFEATDAIAYMPNIGRLDEEYWHTPSFRYLTVLDYRIYYFEEDGVVNIAAIWDCRQGSSVFKDIKE